MDETKNLAKVTDEELVGKLVSALEVQMGEIAYLYSGEPIERAQEVLKIQVAPSLLTIIFPILSARHQKELQDAVGKAVKEKADWMESAWRKYTKSQIGQARIEERKTIGEELSNYPREYCPDIKTGNHIMKVLLPLKVWQSLRSDEQLTVTDESSDYRRQVNEGDW